jgi:hypothetical protein
MRYCHLIYGEKLRNTNSLRDGKEAGTANIFNACARVAGAGGDGGRGAGLLHTRDVTPTPPVPCLPSCSISIHELKVMIPNKKVTFSHILV